MINPNDVNIPAIALATVLIILTADFRLAEQRPFIPRKKQMGGSQKKKY